MDKSPNNITDVIRSIGSGKKASATALINEVGIQNAAVIGKLRKPSAVQEVSKTDRDTANTVNLAELKRISDFVGKRKKDSENIAKLFPDVELAKQIYISSTIAPKDMTSTEILYSVDDPLFPAEVVTKANECIKKNVEQEYKLADELQNILREYLFETGSYVVAVLPESTIDQVINSDRQFSLESASPLYVHKSKPSINDTGNLEIKSLGYLSDTAGNDQIALENFFSGNMALSKLSTNAVSSDNEALGIEVYDNFEMLKMPRLQEAVIKSASKKLIKSNAGFNYRRPALESTDTISIHSGTLDPAKKKMSSEEIRSTTFKAATSGNVPVVSLVTKENAARKSVGRALRMKLPSESVIPVYPPGEPQKHIGYFVLLDITGAPISVENEKGYMDGITGMMNSNLAQNQSTGLNSYLLKKAKDTIIGTDNVPTLLDMSRVYSSVVEKELIARLRNGLYKKDLSIGNNEDIYRMMMFRALAGQTTRMLYVPAELITYYANRYHPNGTGKSMLDDLTMLISTRAVVMVSRVLQQIRSSINTTNVSVNLDPKDPDPEKTMEMTVANVMKYLQFQMPVGLVTQADIYEWVGRAGVRFTFDNHPGVPELKYDFTNDTIGNTLPDTDLDEDLRRRTYMAFGLSPEQVDNSLSPDFATSVLANNALLSKRVLNTQEICCKHMSSDAKKIMSYDVLAYNELKSIISDNLAVIKARIKDSDSINSEDNSDEALITELTDRYIDKLSLGLPRPDLTTIENQMEALEKAEALFDKLLESFVSSEAFPEMVSGEASGKIDEYRGILKAALMRQWVADNPSFKDINDIISHNLDKENKTTLFDSTNMHVKGFVGSFLKFMSQAKPFANAASRDVSNIDNNNALSDEQPAEELPEDTSTDESQAQDGEVGQDNPPAPGVGALDI